MKTIGIFYFSGTGNTEIVANVMKDEFIKLECILKMLRIEDILKMNQQIDLSEYDMIGIGCQVIGFGTPDIVMKFIKQLPKCEGKKTFIFRTAGGVAPLNYNTSRALIRKLDRKGYDVFYERIFSIGSNWINRFDDEVIKQLYEATIKKISIMCRETKQGVRRKLKTSTMLRMKMVFLSFIISKIIWTAGKDMRVSEACSRCGRCINHCPAGNIYLKRGKIRFGNSCNCCMRCIYSCPKGAIHYRLLSFFPVKGGYNIKKILEKPCECSQINEKTAPRFFCDYINNDAL